MNSDSEIDIRLKYLKLISLEDSHVLYQPPILFLFGGPIENEYCDSSSFRNKLYHKISCKRPTIFKQIVIADEFKDWLHDATYPDLLTFESDLAVTSTFIIIVLESAGSIAELGAFLNNQTVKAKLIVILDQEHYEQDSFIKLGLLRQLKNVWAYPSQNHQIILDDKDYDDLIDDISELISQTKKSEAFKNNNNGHIAFLIFDLIQIFKSLTWSELLKFLKYLNLDISEAKLKRLVFLLDKLGLVSRKRYGGKYYYYTKKDESSRIRYASKNNDTPFDKDKATVGAIEYYNKYPKEGRRLRFLGEVL